SSAMTYKFVGVLRSLTDDKPYQRTAIVAGIAIGFAIETLRKLLRPRRFVFDAILLPSPYALSFGGFVNLPTSLWLGAGGVVASVIEARSTRRSDLPPDMSGTSLFGGGLIAGDALAALALGVAGLLATLL
ncbi:MAG TPA: peptide transporter, partial [Ramlibacter sp.]|nr:peptide transporter [Ramlibacter sp.]